ncbi:hypothetical protein GCM10009430_08350 [Aquimarina litoralis]|uniref:DUF6973 domain-containing protein n=1 Tax=Aquimarina litoralis TaxID=584605 RepID=A0ABN1IIZ5_9FLAO
MTIVSLIKRLNIRQLFKLIGLGLQKPLYIIPTFIATKRTLAICDSLYGGEHHLHGKANAFRHSLWNVLICQRVLKVSGDATKSEYWAKMITDLHEKLAPNEPLEQVMDLHNNELGRMYFKKLKDATEGEIISFLELKIKNAKKVLEVSKFHNYSNDLVYIEED